MRFELRTSQFSSTVRDMNQNYLISPLAIHQYVRNKHFLPVVVWVVVTSEL